ncbi:hypothetical protein HCU74_00690 [Spongiibacter sp. KMU-166]|uniref:Calcineurin-like phosphoesterase domain-containing protein n=1 Tax=Spongiibacter thalassae TaxID=2721624 RepID=A0ABX1GBP7_9GAMM|nr:metallophosphoesterase [Spongiibacter thalassae]NKI15922.1 hypothetical protein [Spongiibacter thalassae]
MPRIFAISDLHVDFPENLQYMLSLSNHDYLDDTLIIAGDVSDSLSRLEQLLVDVRQKFRQVAFVPGNHELWVRDKTAANSLEKFNTIMTLCQQVGVHTEPFRVEYGQRSVWLVPLYSWYRTGEADKHSLLITKEGEDWKKSYWMDNYNCRWPDQLDAESGAVADFFLSLNKDAVTRGYDAPILSFSHFLPRKELIFDDPVIAARFCQADAVIPAYPGDPAPTFNFTRVAGCDKLDEQIRQLGAVMHVYGHQHHQRNRSIAGVSYVSNCLGYARERRRLGGYASPKMLWRDGIFLEPEETVSDTLTTPNLKRT